MNREPTDLERFRDAVLGEADAQSWRRERAADVEAALDELRTPAEPTESPPAPPPRKRRNIALLLALPVAGVLCGFAAYQAAFAPLLHDDFSDGWFDPTLWENPPEITYAGLKEERGYLKLLNRGHLLTRKEHPTPVEVTVRWKWINLGVHPNYADHLVIATRTTGAVRPVRPWETLDGVQVILTANGGALWIQAARAEDGFSRDDSLALPMPADEWITVRVADDGNRVRVYIAGPGIDPAFEREPVYQADLPNARGGNRVAIYNREFVAFPHESHLDYVRIDRLRD